MRRAGARADCISPRRGRARARQGAPFPTRPDFRRNLHGGAVELRCEPQRGRWSAARGRGPVEWRAHGGRNVCRPVGAQKEGTVVLQGLTPLAIDWRPFGAGVERGGAVVAPPRGASRTGGLTGRPCRDSRRIHRYPPCSAGRRSGPSTLPVPLASDPALARIWHRRPGS